jgi:molecular chaperone DnaJ
VLGVPRDADQATIKDAFRKLALQYHPDRNKEPGAEERFKEIAEAYAVLSDPKKRTEYDAAGFSGVAGFSPRDLFGSINFEEIFGGLGFDSGAESLFDRFFRRRRPGPPQGANLEVDLKIPLERVLRGGAETVRVTRPAMCTACRGSGAKAGTAPRRCEACGGAGHQVVSRRQGGVTFQSITTCPACRGLGRVIDEPCPECGGRGRIERDETLTVNIPIGVEEGMALRIPGHGLPSDEPAGRPGDLFVVVRSAPDPRFERDGTDLWRTEGISVADAVLGTSLEVPTLDGRAVVTVPPATQPDAVLRLRGKGLPEFGGGRRGDVYLRLRIRVPEKLTAEERKLWERLRALGGKERRARA